MGDTGDHGLSFVCRREDSATLSQVLQGTQRRFRVQAALSPARKVHWAVNGVGFQMKLCAWGLGGLRPHSCVSVCTACWALYLASWPPGDSLGPHCSSRECRGTVYPLASSLGRFCSEYLLCRQDLDGKLWIWSYPLGLMLDYTLLSVLSGILYMISVSLSVRPVLPAYRSW